MTRIVIEDVTSLQDLYAALAAVTQAFDSPDKFESEEETFSKSQGQDSPPECSDTDADGPSVSPISVTTHPLPYVPCPRRGTHLRLTECWACWCDVQRGVFLNTEVLAPEAWDLALSELVSDDDPPPSGPRE